MQPRRKSSQADPNPDHPPALPDDPVDSPATMERIIDVVTNSDAFLAQRVRNAFVKAGFGIRRITREEYHPTVWVIWLTRGCVDLPRDNNVASKEVRRALAKCGVKIRAGELTVLEQRGDKLKCAFLYGSAP